MQGILGGRGVSPWSGMDVVNPDLVRQRLHINPQDARGGRLLPPASGSSIRILVSTRIPLPASRALIGRFHQLSRPRVLF